MAQFRVETAHSRNYNIMRPLSFDPQLLRKHLPRHKIATLPELKQALGTSASLPVFRKLKLLDLPVQLHSSRPLLRSPGIGSL